MYNAYRNTNSNVYEHSYMLSFFVSTIGFLFEKLFKKWPTSIESTVESCSLRELSLQRKKTLRSVSFVVCHRSAPTTFAILNRVLKLSWTSSKQLTAQIGILRLGCGQGSETNDSQDEQGSLHDVGLLQSPVSQRKVVCTTRRVTAGLIYAGVSRKISWTEKKRWGEFCNGNPQLINLRGLGLSSRYVSKKCAKTSSSVIRTHQVFGAFPSRVWCFLSFKSAEFS